MRKNILPRHSRRVALHVDTVFVPTILVRYQFRNAHGEDMSCEVLGVKYGGAQPRCRTLTILVASRSLVVVAEKFVARRMLKAT